MFLFILESIGTSELILIAAVALIVFGPRRLPQMAKTIGKTMSEFRNATNEFKSTWEKEVAFEENGEKPTTPPLGDNQILSASSPNQTSSMQSAEQFPQPTIKELSANDITEKFRNGDNIQNSATNEEVTGKAVSDKRDWL